MRSSDQPDATVTGLLVKPVPHQPLLPRRLITASTRRGLDGDCHAQALGPRQVLVVRQEALDELGVAASQVRANVAVRGLASSDLESGRVLEIGETRIRVTHECEICSVLRAHLDRETYRQLPGRRGSLGVILRGGEIRLGDAVSIGADRWPTIPERIGDRALWVIARIPSGRVLAYDRLIMLIGGKRAHFRVLPTYVRRAQALGLPAHRVISSAGAVTRHVVDQAGRLAVEGVRTDRDGLVIGSRAAWDGAEIYFAAN